MIAAPPRRAGGLLACLAMTHTPPESEPAPSPSPYGVPPSPYGAAPPAWGPSPYGPVLTVASDPAKLNRPAVWAFVSSLLGCFGAFAIGGLVGGIVALNQIRQVPQRGKGLAWSAIVISSVWLVVTVALLGLGMLDPTGS
jgi:Domain of unknown function (DUF4190)